MKSLLRLTLKNKLITLIILVAVLLRLIGIYPSFPQDHPDEWAYGSAIVMIYENNFDPQRYDYPAGQALLLWVFFKFLFIPVAWVLYFIIHIGDILDGVVRLHEASIYRIFHHDIVGVREINVLIWGRLITALFGTLVVWLTYLISRKTFGWWASVAATFFVAVSWREVLNSHIGLPDIFNAFFLMLSVICLLRLFERSSFKNYLLTAVSIAIYFSIKFQVFTIGPFFLIHLYHCWQNSNHNLKGLVKSLLRPEFLISLLLIPIIVIILNPYHLINFEKFKEVNTYTFSKYGNGSYSMSGYSFAYLYHHAFGAITSLLIILGIILAVLTKSFWKTVIILSVIGQFFFVFTYYSRGGFYTRNFVTIIPLLLVFAGVPIGFLALVLMKRFSKFICSLLVLMVITIVSWSNITKSYTVATTYTSPWNIIVIRTWLEQNIPENAKVSAHSNVPLAINDDQRYSYDFHKSFSIDEFSEEGQTDYAVTNFAWATGGFYWWMGGDFDTFVKHYWNKPVDIMDYSYPAVAIRELEPYVVFSTFKPWIAPDTDFMVAKVPKFSVENKELKRQYSFETDAAGWEKTGNFWLSADLLKWDKGGLVIGPGAASLESVRWRSSVIDVENWSGFEVDFTTIDESTKDQSKSGYVFVDFYANRDDALAVKNRLGVRVSSRTATPNQWLEKQLIGPIPKGASVMTINFGSYDSANALSRLSKVDVYQAKVDVDLGGVQVHPIRIDDGNLFPNSHGNL